MNERTNPSVARLSQITVHLWRVLGNPRVVFGLAVFLILEGLVAFELPQKPSYFSTPADFIVWISNLPPFFQHNFQWLDALGLFRIFQSAWFWFPASLLSLTTLVALADMIPATWQRIRQSTNSIAHPLSHTHTETIRLEAPQDTGQATDTEPTLSALKDTLIEKEYRVQTFADDTIVASRHLWRWNYPAVILIGILFLLFGGAIQTIWGDSNQTSLVENHRPMPFINHQILLSNFQPVSVNSELSGGILTLSTEDGQTINLQLGRWTHTEGWWIAPPRPRPNVQISFEQQKQGAPERLSMVFEDTSRPLIVAYSPQEISLELRYRIENNQPAYRLSAHAQTDAQNIDVTQIGENFSISALGITGKVVLQDKFSLKAYKLPGLIPFILGAIFLGVGMVQFLMPPPVFVNIKTVTKGRGSRIKASAEGLAKPEKLQSLLSKIIQNKQEDVAND